MEEHYCQYILDCQYEGHGIADRYDDPKFNCCGKVARLKFWSDPDQWLCAEHYDLVVSLTGTNPQDDTAPVDSVSWERQRY